MKTPDIKPQPQTARETRLARALRANLRRRKASAAPPPEPKTPAEDTE